jgi:hypothetical protein
MDQDYMNREKARKEVMDLYRGQCHCTFHHRSHYPEWGYQWHNWGKPIGEMFPNFYDSCHSAIDEFKEIERCNI